MAQRDKIKCMALTYSKFKHGTMVLILTIQIGGNDHDTEIFVEDIRVAVDKHGVDDKAALKEDIDQPIIIWWTPFTGEQGSYKTCGDVFMFYGTDLKEYDLPLPRLPDHEWGLLHEESPKNNYLFSHQEVMTLFNHTCTFKRESTYPITTQYVESIKWLEDTKYMVPVKEKNKLLSELSPIIYTQTDCDTPSDRDTYVKLLMKYIHIDAYGTCLHNKDLPKHLQDPLKGMDDKDFYKINGKYKFTIAMENGICNDYITEKVWRPLVTGSIPIIFGSPKIQDFLPSNQSAIIIDKFKDIESVAKFIKYLNDHDEEYEKYRNWKRTGITNQNLKNIMKNRGWSINNNWKDNEYNFIDGFRVPYL
ncbi:hypothetical protein KUTeg_003077 [Tegillarca granosa]|uniref:Fucosyltransferase n=1 Tax=Tegillarca granosa TaxID=220873 RepID=A0ABQ9FMP0_TEGGR|nr:hypothetical protein KUTeg_003077 [Tegillarca granosa]